MNANKVLLSIAKTHLTSRARQTITATLGVTFGIAAYITLASFMTGLNQMLDDLILNQTPHVHIYNEIKPSEKQPADLVESFKNSLNIIHSVRPKLSQKRIPNALPLIESLNNRPEVMAAVPQVRSQVFYIAGSIELGGNLTGIDIKQETAYFNFGDYIMAGAPKELENSDNGILIGAGVAKRMSLDMGDRIQVLTTSGVVFPLKIVGIYQSGIAEIDNVQSFTSIKTAQKLNGDAINYITDINIKLHQIEGAAKLASEIGNRFGLTAVDIKTANAQFETGTSIRNLITYAVSITLLIVAGFGIYNILNMLIYEKMNDIAILKATGFSAFDVQRIFMAEAILIGLAGGVTGLLLGAVLSYTIDGLPFETEALPTINTYPVNHNPLFYVIGFTFSIAVTFFASYLPAIRAKKIDPVTIIRGL